MFKNYILMILAILCVQACSSGQPVPEAITEADVIFTGKIYTGTDEVPIAEIVTVKNGRFTGVFAQTPEGLEPDTRFVSLKEGVGYPGFVDGHAHLDGIGFRELTLNLEGTSSIAELVARVETEVADAAPDEVIFGRGWIETGWPEGRFPNRDDLDAVAPNNPVILARADGHAVLVNSRAIELAGITDATADPDGGAIERDEAGRATGLLIDNAENLVMTLVEAPSAAQRRNALKVGSSVYAAYGWTGIHSMSVNPDDTGLLVELEEAGELPIRVYNSITPAGLDSLIESGIWKVNGGKVTTRAVKFYVDGALGSRGAALKAPYSDKPDSEGLLLLSEEKAKDVYRRALANGIQITTHAIGDRGNALVLDWYRDALEGHEGADPRWRIEHAQIIDPVDIPRFAELNVIASMQPSHAIGDLHFAPDRLGNERLDGAYAWRSLTDSGALIVGGSDAPVERGDPMIEFYAAVGRMDLKGYQGDNWRAEEILTRMEALKIFTLNPAIASFSEEDLGTIEIGKRADLTVLSSDIMTIPVAEILNVKALKTIVDGRVVYDVAD